MIRSFASAETERFFRTGRSRRMPTEIRERAMMRLKSGGHAHEVEIVDYH
jgi:proteic killer suppression protein